MRAAQAAARPGGGHFGALRHRNFALFWSGLLISHIGTWMQNVGQGWLTYELTNTPVWLGLNSLAFAIPMVVLPLFGGAAADRFPRIRLIQTLQLIMAAATAILTGLTYLGLVQAWHLVASSLIGGIVLAFESPSRHASILDLVDEDDLVSAVSLVTSSYQIGGLIGPALAGVLLGALGNERIYILFGLNALSFLAYVMNLSFIRTPAPHRGPRDALLDSLGSGVRLVWSRPPLRALLALIMTAGVFGRSFVALMPVFARDVLRTGAQGLGYLMAAPGIGVIIGATLVSGAGLRERKGATIITSTVVFACALGAFALSRLMPLSLALLVVVGMSTIASSAMMQATLQLAAPAEVRGRVMSLSAIANVGLPNVGAMLTASAAAVIGAPIAVAGGAVLIVLVVLLLGRRVLQLD